VWTWASLAIAPYAQLGLKVWMGMGDIELILFCYFQYGQIFHCFAADDASYKRSADLDVVTKCNRFRNCAESTKDVPPNLSCNFAGPEAQVRALEAEGKLNLRSFVDSDGLTDASHDGDVRECTSNFHCARPDTNVAEGTTCDVHGLCGGVCSHGLPLRGAFIDLHGSEQFIYYLIIITALVTSCPNLGFVYVDFACRLSVTWKRYLSKHGSRVFPSQELLSAAKGLNLLVNWMHGSAHDLSCQLRNSGRYTVGAGRRHGEGSEQLWSLMKVSNQGYSVVAVEVASLLIGADLIN
jgi:hypothetical protein